MINIAVVAVSAPALSRLTEFQREFERNYGTQLLQFQMFYAAKAGVGILTQEEKITEAIAAADLAVIDIMGASEAVQDMVREALLRCGGQRIVIGNSCRELIRLGAFSMAGMKKAEKSEDKKVEEKAGGERKKNGAKLMHTMRRMALMMGSVAPFGMMKDMKNLFLLIDYWQQASREDIFSFMHLILRGYFGMKQLPKEKPCSMKYGIYLKNPQSEECLESVRTYWKKYGYDQDKPTAAVLFYGHSYPNDFLPVAAAVCEKLSQTFNVLPIAFSQNEDKDLKKLENYLTSQKENLEKLRVPYFKPLCLTKTERREWAFESGVNAGEFLISILLPELDGGIHTYPLGIMEKMENSSDITRIVPIEERVSTLCGRIQRFSALRRKPNQEKKIAILCYNYPPGEDNLFGGAFLDTFQSMEVILHELRQAGYTLEGRTARQLQEFFCQDGACNQPRWADERVSEQTYILNQTEYPVNGIQDGNVFIGLQPCREEGQVTQESYHDKNAGPPASYQAYYRWLQEEFQADAVIHVGTHGTLEFLPGKETGMTKECWPDRLIGEIPHFYFYYVGNPSEAMVAKRRSHAVLVGYQPPAYEPGGLYGEYRQLKEMIAEYRESLQSAPERCGDLLEDIGKKAQSLSLSRGRLQEKDLDELDELLYDYERSLIPGGLHVIGKGYSGQEAQRYAQQVLDYAGAGLETEKREQLREKLVRASMENREMEGMLRALNGEYLPVSVSGDILKNPKILPSGNNLVQFDPRLVPTRTAFERGAKIAQKTLEKYREEKGCYPESTAVILWGLETSKTQGETVGQILYYLGVGLKKDEGSFDSRFEILSSEELGRPRVDVTIHICGFFRDMFPNLLDNLNEIFRKLMLLDETEEQSYFARNTRRNYQRLREQGYSEEEAQELARSRIFGPKEGEYGSSLEALVKSGDWEREEELGLAFTDSLSYVYGESKKGAPAADLLRMNYQGVEVVSQVRNNVEYELIDLDHYYEFYGGLAKSIENVRGEKASMYVADTVGAQIRIQGLGESLEKGIATRLLNPKWIEGMMRHDYHGVQQISRRFENVIGMAATTNQIDSGVFSRMEACYVEDEELKKRMQQSNRWAYLGMLGRLMEANNRGYWQATEEELERLRRAYLETEGEIEH